MHEWKTNTATSILYSRKKTENGVIIIYSLKRFLFCLNFQYDPTCPPLFFYSQPQEHGTPINQTGRKWK